MPNEKTLVIVESPAKCKKIESYLRAGGHTAHCIASFGHFREIAGLESINMTTYEPLYSNIKGKKQAFDSMKNNINVFDRVVLATDDDREGEAIAWHICDTFGLDPLTTDRIIFHEITQSAVIRAYENPTYIDMPLVRAQQARQTLDMLIGYRISPMLWKYVVSGKGRAGLSAGRCQTPALRVLCDIDRLNEMNTNSSTTKLDTTDPRPFTFTGYFTPRNIPFTMKREYTDGEVVAFLSNNTKRFTANKPVVRERTVQSPSGFSTLTLQQEAHTVLQMTPKQCMSAAQTLYELGHITYMRTESERYSEEIIRDGAEYLSRKYAKFYVRDMKELICRCGVSDTSTDAHEAIRPTKMTITKLDLLVDNSKSDEKLATKLTQQVRRLYRLIWNRTAESLMCDSRVETHNFKFITDGYEFTTSMDKTVFPGWKIINEKNNSDDVVGKNIQYLSDYINRRNNIDPPDAIDWTRICCIESVDSGGKVALLTEPGLIRRLRDRGIGRPSTFASIVETLKDRNYVSVENIAGQTVETIERMVVCSGNTTIELDEWVLNGSIWKRSVSRTIGSEKSKMVVSKIGRRVVEFLERNFSELFEYKFTAKMEETLDDIATGGKGNCRTSESTERTYESTSESTERTYESTYESTCRTYDTIIRSAVDIVERELSANTGYTLDPTHRVLLGKYGLVVEELDCQCKHVKFHSITNDDIDIDRALRGEYSLEELIGGDNTVTSPYGLFENVELTVKKGRYGYYAKWGDKSCNLHKLNIPIGLLTRSDILGEIQKQTTTRDVSLLRHVDDEISVRRGKRGDYIMMNKKTKRKSSKPQFVALGDFLEWVRKTHRTDNAIDTTIDTIDVKLFHDFLNTCK